MLATKLADRIRVTFDLVDLAIAIKYSEIYTLSSGQEKLSDSTTYQRDLPTKLSESVVGVLGEMASCRFIGIGSPKVGAMHRIADVGLDIECRSTNRLDGRLIFRLNDNPERRFILAVVSARHVDLIGWIFGREAMVDAYKSNPNGYREAWFVPQDKLRPMNDFAFDGLKAKP